MHHQEPVSHEFLDGHRTPPVEVDLVTMAGFSVRTAMPSGVFTGMTRPASCAMAAVPLPLQKSQQAIEVVSTVLASALGGADVSVQGALDAK